MLAFALQSKIGGSGKSLLCLQANILSSITTPTMLQMPKIPIPTLTSLSLQLSTLTQNPDPLLTPTVKMGTNTSSGSCHMIA